MSLGRDIAAFRDMGRVANAHVLLDVNSNELKLRRQTFLNRAVDWIRARVSPNPLAATERDVAHNRFLAAIAQSSAYDSGDVSRAEALLSVELLEGRPLSTRRVREVLADLDSRSTEVERDNRTTIAWMSTRGLDQQLGARNAGEHVTEEERALLGARIGEAIQRSSTSGLFKVGFAEASEATERVVDTFLAEKATLARAEEQTRADRTSPDGVAPTTSANETERTEPDVQAAPATPTPVPEAPATVGAPTRGEVDAARTPAAEARGPVPPRRPPEAAQGPGAPRRPSQKELLRTLARAKLPARLRPELRRLVKSSAIVDEAGLARRGNRFIADWVIENRIGRWYGEALKNAGARGRIRNGEELMAPTRMLDEVRRSIAESKGLLAYADVKRQARALVAEHVRSEMDGRV